MNVTALYDAVVTHAEKLGQFEQVNTHEPKNAPGNGLQCAVWVQEIGPTSSGLAVTSARVEFSVRIYSNMLQEPQDLIDPNIFKAVDALLTAYSGDFTLGGTVRSVDLTGMGGNPLRAVAGYLAVDNKMFRIMTVTLPVLINDAWSQAA